MRIASRLAVLTMVAATGIGLTALPAAATANASAPLWVSRLHNATTTGDAVAVSPDGATVFATGVDAVSPRVSYGETVAYDAATGAQLWHAVYTAKSDFASITVSPDGSTVFVTGTSQPDGAKALTIAYNATTGATLWTQTAGKNAGGRMVAVAPNGSAVYIAGRDNCSKTVPGCYLVAAYDPTTGASLWTDQVANSGGADSIAVGPGDAVVYVTGSVAPGGAASQYSTLAFNAATGATTWSINYTVAGASAYANSVAVSPGGSMLYVTGYMQKSVSVSGYRTVAYSASGMQLWQQPFSVRQQGLGDSLAVSPDGSTVFVTGTVGLHEDSYGTVAYDATAGTRLWTAIHTGHHGQPSALAVSPDGSTLYVTGNGDSAPSTAHPDGIPQYATLAYNCGTGASKWVRYFGDVTTGDSYAYSVAVSPDSSTVYVTGRNITNLTTVAYGS